MLFDPCHAAFAAAFAVAVAAPPAASAPVARGQLTLGAETYVYELVGGAYVLRNRVRAMRTALAADGTLRLQHVEGALLRNHALRTLRVRAGRLEVVS